MALAGCDAAAWGFRLARVQCYPYYPITPSTVCSERIARWISDGEMEAVVINVESEHSAASAVIAAGKSVRAGTATSSKGLLYMLEVLENGSGGSIPFTMFVGTRATGGPINIWGDHTDAYAMRDSGLVQLFAADGQETLDLVVQAYRISEDLTVRQPATVNLRGFTGTHTYEGVDVPDQADVDGFLPPFVSPYSPFAPARPVTYNPMLSALPYRRHKRNQAAALRNAVEVAARVGKEFGERFGRPYGLFDWIGDARADLVVALMGESAGTAEAVLHHLRGTAGIPGVAVLKLRLFSPFPGAEIARALIDAGTKALVVFEEGLAHGAVFPPLAQRLATALQIHGRGAGPQIASAIGGLGGSQVTHEDFQTLFNLAENIAEGRPYRAEPYWLGIDEDPVLLGDERGIAPALWKRYGEIWRQQPRKEKFFSALQPRSYEMRIYSRAGQGAITSAIALTAAAVEQGVASVTTPTFGSERRGAIITADTLISFEPERKLRAFSGLWDLVLIYDDTILFSPDHRVAATLKPGGTLLVNTTRFTPERIRALAGFGPERGRVFVVPAREIARSLGLGDFFNMVMLGAVHRVCPHLDFERALRYYAQDAPRPREANMSAIRRGFEETTETPPPRAASVPPDESEERLIQWRPEMPWESFCPAVSRAPFADELRF
jgi:pyruvate ferredoxin oxidoreductase alpha subunit